jgi:hypothetical protein
VVALSDSNADVVERYSYDIFGQPSAASSVGNPYLFTGRRYDPEVEKERRKNDPGYKPEEGDKEIVDRINEALKKKEKEDGGKG